MKTTKAHASTEYVEENKNPVIGGLRIAKVTYEHYPIKASNDGGTIGYMIDQHISDIINDDGGLVSEVSLFFETIEQQHIVREMYEQKKEY